MCVDAERDHLSLSMVFPSVPPCCLTSFPLFLYLIRGPLLQCGNEACGRKAAPPGIQTRTPRRGREAHAYRSFIVSLNPTASVCFVLSLHCISVCCSLMCCHETHQMRCYCVCLCALSHLLWILFLSLYTKRNTPLNSKANFRPHIQLICNKYI